MAVSFRESVGHRSDRELSLRASIVMVSYNARDKLLACLTSLLPAIPEDCELIIVDNDSSEGNAGMIEERFPEANLIRSATNLGFAGGCNLGVRRARGRYLVFLNPDTIVEPGWLDALVKPFESDERAGLVTSKILLLDPPGLINTCGCDVNITGLTLCRGMGRPQSLYTEPDEVSAISGAAFAIRHELFDELGGFDEEMFLYMEDTDLSWRARLLGWRTLYTPESRVFHDYRLRITPLKVFWQERNRPLMLLKSYKWPTLFVMLPVLLLGEVITWGFVLLNDRANLGNKIKAYRWIISNWGLIMRKRTAIQRLRTASDREMIRSTVYRLDFGQAASPAVATLAQFVFNPIFFVLRTIILAVVWW